jgi:ADP-heptose:LPS heptosyltransferase
VSPTERVQSPGSPLRGRYLVRNRAWNAWLRVNDFVLDLMHGRARAATNGITHAPKRVLLAVGGHIGDAVIASSVLRPLLGAIPGVQIGVMTGSWNRQIFEGHPAVRWLHSVDHWKSSRSGRTLFARWLVARRSRAQSVRELRSVGYDAALDLSAYYPNFARVLHSAAIPVRIGYPTGGDGALYTDAVEWKAGRHVTEDHLSLLQRLVPSLPSDGSARYELTPASADSDARAHGKLVAGGLTPRRYAVLHVGAGLPRKEWPVEHWRRVAAELASSDLAIVLTGTGHRQRTMTERVSSGQTDVVNLCDQLDWEEFRSVVRGARIVLSVDTVAMHIAAAEGVPCVALMTGMDDPARWRPVGGHTTVLSEPVHCSPCFRSRGCSEMSCIQDITPESVVRATRAQLGR